MIKKNVRPQMPSIFAAVKKYHGRHLFHFLEGKPKILSYKKSKRQDWVAQTSFNSKSQLNIKCKLISCTFQVLSFY